MDTKDIPVTPEMEEMNRRLQEVLNSNDMEDTLTNNEKIFELDGITYRIRKATNKQSLETYKKRVEKYSELLQDKKYMLENDLKKVYLNRGIDVDAITADIRNLITKRDTTMVHLGEAIKNSASEEDLATLKKEIEEINLEIQKLSFRKSQLLEVSIEQQVLIFTYNYLTFLLPEKKEGENWVKVWASYEEYENSNSKLVDKCAYYITLMSTISDL
jgi:hypothetical protein